MSADFRIDEILFNASPGETRAALVSEGRLVELFIERHNAASLVGSIHLGRVAKLVPGMEAAFVDLAASRAGFLAREDARDALNIHGTFTRGRKGEGSVGPITHYVNEGEAIVVQVTKDAFAQKGPRVSTQIAIPGHRLVYTPARPGLSLSRRIAGPAERARLEAALMPHLETGEGVILRTAAEGVDSSELASDLIAARKLWRDALARAKSAKAPALLLAAPDPIDRVLRDHAGTGLKRVFCDRREARARAKELLARVADKVEVHHHQGPEPLFSRHDIEDQIALALEPVVDLPSGGTLVIGTLEALTAIDVNTARHTNAGRFSDAILAVNLEAAREIARQVRLRNIAGLIVVDFVHMAEPSHRDQVVGALRNAFAADPVTIQVGGMTPLGLFEMTRMRVRESLRDTLMAPCGSCHGTGWLKSAESVAYEILRAVERAADASPGRALTVLASDEVVVTLNEEAKAAREGLEAQLGRPFRLRIEPAYGRERFDIVTG